MFYFKFFFKFLVIHDLRASMCVLYLGVGHMYTRRKNCLVTETIKILYLVMISTDC